MSWMPGGCSPCHHNQHCHRGGVGVGGRGGGGGGGGQQGKGSGGVLCGREQGQGSTIFRELNE